MIKFAVWCIVLVGKVHFSIQNHQIPPWWWPHIWPDLCWWWQWCCLDEDGLFLRDDYTHKSVIILTWKTRGRHRKRERLGGRERNRNKWFVSPLTTMKMMEERGEEITGRIRQLVFILTWASRCTSSRPWQTSTAKHQREKRSARGHGVPPRGKAFLNPSVHTHTHT